MCTIQLLPMPFIIFLSTRSACLIPNAIFKLPPTLYFMRVPGTAALLGALQCTNATSAGGRVSSQTRVPSLCHYYNLAASVFQQEDSVCSYLPSGFFCWWPVVVLLIRDQGAHVGSHATSSTGTPVAGGYCLTYSTEKRASTMTRLSGRLVSRTF